MKEHVLPKNRVSEMLEYFDNHDSRLPYYELMLERDLKNLPEYPLPDGYHFEHYVPGDRDTWIEIEKSAKEFSSLEDGQKAWEKYYAEHESELMERMFFIVNNSGQKIATATAFYDIRKGDDGINGWLHWVAVSRKEQGRGLSKPIIAEILHFMAELGYSRVVVPTQSTTWLACKVYLDLGFRPIPKNAERSRKGWEIIRSLTHHPALSDFTETDVKRFLL